MKNPFPAYQWYARDYLSSSAHATMTLEEQGAYRNLLDRAWIDDPPCSLPDDDVQLAQLSGAGAGWADMSEKLRQWFTPRRGRLWNLKQLENFRELLTHRAVRSQAGIIGGRRSAEVRANRVNQTSTTEQAKSNPASASASASAKEEYVRAFEIAFVALPRREGPNSRKEAFAAFVARLRSGVPAADLQAGAERYAKYIRGSGQEGTRFVMQAKRFFGSGECWRENYGNNGNNGGVSDRKTVLRNALVQVRRQDPKFRGGVPDHHSTGIFVEPRDYPVWQEVLAEAGLDVSGVSA